MAQVVVLLVGLDPAILDVSDVAPEEEESEVRAAVRERIEHNLAWLRRLGYEADFCGTDEGATAPELLLKMMRAKSYNCIVFGADIRLSLCHTRLFERLLNLAQVTKPDTVILFDNGWDDTVRTVRRWYPSSDSG